MVTLVKHEWHQVDSQFSFEVDEDTVREVYPDLDDEEVSKKLEDLVNGELDVDKFVEDAMDNDVYFDWERFDDDWWTERKGGYDVTYEVSSED